MKKYIFHDDGVYEIKIDEEDKKADVENYLYYDYSPHLRICMTEEEVNSCKQADTIEELCDEFVIKGKNWYQIISLENAKYNARIGRLNELEIYGAIWTDKGLIYVAKMNESGKLELL